MGNCIYCGHSAGLLRKQHKECATKNHDGWTKMVDAATKALTAGNDLDALEPALFAVAKESFVPSQHVRNAFIQAWQRAVDRYLEDGLLTEDEEGRLLRFKEHFTLDQRELDGSGALMRVVKAGLLRDLMNGKVPERVDLTGGIPFNLQKSEKLIWLFTGAQYLAEKTRRHYEGRSAGVSIRIAKGVYYRTGAFKGYPVETTYTTHEDSGLLGVSTKHLYFSGSRKHFRIAHNKVVALIPFTDGVGVHRDAASARPQFFKTGDGWFTYNLFANVSQL